MKKSNFIYPLIMTLLLFVSCKEDETVDITVMPKATQTGANTFGCLVDGWLYVGGRYSGASWFESRSSINFQYYPQKEIVTVDVQVKFDENIVFTIVTPQEGSKSAYTDVKLGSKKMNDGTVTVTRFDKELQIISGIFEGGRITQGRFDVRFEYHD